MKLIYASIVIFVFSTSFISFVKQDCEILGFQTVATPPNPAIVPSRKPTPDLTDPSNCTTCMPEILKPRRKFEIPLIDPTRRNPGFSAISKFRRNSEDTRTDLSIEINGLDKTKPYFIYTIDTDGRVTQIDRIAEGETKAEAKTELKSFIIAVSPEKNITEFQPEKFILINEPAQSFIKLRKAIETTNSIKSNQ